MHSCTLHSVANYQVIGHLLSIATCDFCPNINWRMDLNCPDLSCPDLNCLRAALGTISNVENQGNNSVPPLPPKQSGPNFIVSA